MAAIASSLRSRLPEIEGGGSGAPRQTPDQREVLFERARKLRLENDEREGQLASIDMMMAEWDQIIGPIKADLATVPPRVTDDIELRRRIEDGINAALNSLADRFEQGARNLQDGRDRLADHALADHLDASAPPPPDQGPRDA
jgi:hypothetical protein